MPIYGGDICPYLEGGDQTEQRVCGGMDSDLKGRSLMI